MRRRAWLALLVAGVLLGALDSCGTDDAENAAVPFDAGSADRTSGMPPRRDGESALDAADVTIVDAGGSDADANADGPEAGPFEPCTQHDAGDAGCAWIRVSWCGGQPRNFYEVCGATHVPGRGWTCGGVLVDLASAGGPDGGTYHEYKPNRCPDDACPIDSARVVWRCFECCAK